MVSGKATRTLKADVNHGLSWMKDLLVPASMTWKGAGALSYIFIDTAPQM